MSYSNPAFAALGIKSFKLPSRNWMIFWTVVGTLGGGIVYDKWKQRQLRAQYMEMYANKCANYPVDEVHRKLRIYVSPPPNDYLDESMKYFRRFVKPIINASGVDFELVTMERQGDIRYKVAEEIRALRREKAGLEPKKKKEEDDTGKEVSASTPAAAANINPVFQSYKVENPKNEEGEIKAVRDLYEPMDVLGVKRVFGDFHQRVENVKSEDALVTNVRDAGGIICIGRGAFKEYINGVHEGLLGPLEEKEKEDDEKYAPAAYIYAKDYKESTIAPELGLDKVDFNDDVQFSRVLQTLRDEKSGVPYFFVQPILELRNYNVSGFTRQPERMWRFYHKREQLIEYKDKVVELIERKWCAFTRSDLDNGIEEEGDWPSSWLKVAKKNNSEWIREFDGDDRVMKVLASYNCKCDKDAAPDATSLVDETQK
ncbi:hypothetical protein PICMEDRAFT_126855 [Pichia membranifaciens NRRL Y-2026]|uniref:Mitochondrial import inner membrane translocase subunit TIM54 n=1 Tax=Pichia membranifaciens NRRL Y-2026 TaxID=763406 RepID=A0A1E3NJC7_9ASCO|nr:hypothetical protein PICMEDRAFT_126855 [Pichia membranifaciens NRRL Y-2026]ODQ46247.1 hypothetical protein PICMEDRAFT_126855 [Pichia membranifaciens NRRL Y-2026]